MTRSRRILLLILLVLAAACQPDPKQKAEQLARHQMEATIGAKAVERAHVEIFPSRVGWMVVFRDANATCEEGVWWPGACDFAQTNQVYTDVYVCVERDGNMRQMGASSDKSLRTEDLCQAPPPGQTATVAPTMIPNP